MCSSQLIKFTNCRVLLNKNIIIDDLWVRDGKIVDPEAIFYHEKIQPHIVHDMEQNILAPGFIDIQINGGYGIDFTTNTDCIQKGIRKVAIEILANGVTSFCPTMVTTDPERYREILPKFERKNGSEEGAGIIGVHLEGPFINIDRKGAHSSDKIREFDNGINSFEFVYGNLDNVSIVTLAPEKNVSEIIEYLSGKNILVSLGHSSATLNDGINAVNRGASCVTHLFNAMTPFHHREPGLVGLISENDKHQIYYGLIADGVHVHPNCIKFAYRANPQGIILVTDAISALGKTEGTHQLGDKYIEVKNNAAYIAGTDILCGSVAKMNECVKFFKESTNCSVGEALEAASFQPAQALRIENKGSFNFGKDADIVCIDDDFNVLSTWISGVRVYKKKIEP